MYEQVVTELYDHGYGGCETWSSSFKVAVQFPCTGEQHPAHIEQASAQRIRLAHFLRRCVMKKVRGNVGRKVLSTVATARPVTAPHCTATSPKTAAYLGTDPSHFPELTKTISKLHLENTKYKELRKYLDQIPQNARPSNPPPHLRRHNNPLVLHRSLNTLRLPNQLLHPISTAPFVEDLPHIPIPPPTPSSQNPQQRRLRPRALPPRHLQTWHLKPSLRRRARRRLALHPIIHARRSVVLFIHVVCDVETGMVSVG